MVGGWASKSMFDLTHTHNDRTVERLYGYHAHPRAGVKPPTARVTPQNGLVVTHFGDQGRLPWL